MEMREEPQSRKNPEAWSMQEFACNQAEVKRAG